MAGTDINTKAETYHDLRVKQVRQEPRFIVNAGTRSFSSDLCAWDCCVSDRRPEAQAPGKQLIYLFIPPRVKTKALKPTQQKGQLKHIVACLGPNSKALGSTDRFFSLFHFKQHKLSFPVETGSLPPFPITQATHLLSEPSTTHLILALLYMCLRVCPFSCPHHPSQVSRMKLCGRQQQSTE